MPARVVASRVAEADLEGISDHISQDSPEAAGRFVDFLRERCLSLRGLPYRGKPFGRHHRALIAGQYLIIYRASASEAGITVTIVRVIHGARESSGLWQDA
jgi:plasmid stabilization system protein ParE